MQITCSLEDISILFGDWTVQFQSVSKSWWADLKGMRGANVIGSDWQAQNAVTDKVWQINSSLPILKPRSSNHNIIKSSL